MRLINKIVNWWSGLFSSLTEWQEQEELNTRRQLKEKQYEVNEAAKKRF
jgi:hypothetical protein